MPNHCETRAVISTTTKDDLDIFMSMAKPKSSAEEDDKDTKELVVSMEAIMPTPPHLLDSTKDFSTGDLQKAITGDSTYEYASWYDWRVAHWGTKWDMYDQEVDDIGYFSEFNDYRVSLRYNTAWSPNIRFWKNFTKIAPLKVDMTYLDEGWGFAGRTVIQDGNIDEYVISINDEFLSGQPGVVYNEAGEIDWDETELNDEHIFDYVIAQYDKGERTNG